MRIGELAKLTGKSVAALRYYEQVGLLKPARRTHSGYREYAQESVERVCFISRGQEQGFSLREIAAILNQSDAGQSPCGGVVTAARAKIDHLEQRIARLQQRRAFLLKAVRLWKSGGLDEAPYCPLLNFP